MQSDDELANPADGESSTDSVTAEVYASVEDGVSTITLNRPGRMNALTRPMRSLLFQILSDADEDPTVRVIVLTGAGRGFCAGMDFASLAGSDEAEPVPVYPLDLPMRIRTPLIAAVNGHAAGVGLAYALMADVRVAAAGAKWVAPYGNMGLVAELGIPWLMQRLAGLGATLDLLLRGAPITSEEAFRLGLAQYVCKPDQVLPQALDIARQIAGNPTHSMREIKEQVTADASRSWDDAFADSVERMTRALASEDFKRSMAERSKQ